MRLLMLCLMLLSFSAAAQVYTYIDAEGNRVFTDKPKASNAKRVELPTTNTMPVPGQESAKAPVAKIVESTEPHALYQLLRILVPQPDATVRSNNGDLIVSATSEPGLQPGHRYRLLVDGLVAGDAGTSPVFPLNNLDRGTHQLSVEVIDDQDRTVERTPNQPVHILRTSLAQRRTVQPCKRDEYGVRPECPIGEKPKDPNIPFVPFI